MARWIGGFLIAAIIVAGLAFYNLNGGFSQKEERPADVIETNAKKLGLQTPERKTAAPEFTLEDQAGKQVALKDLRGKVVFLNFWATWCRPCIQEMPALEKLHRDLEKDGLVILAVNFQESPERVKDFLTEHELTFTALLDRDGKVFELYQAWALPASVIIDKRGEVIGKAMGLKDWHSEEAFQLFRKLLAEES
ncbi:MAG: peroxiredoxin family protein [Candidatus Binatia bacterium]